MDNGQSHGVIALRLEWCFHRILGFGVRMRGPDLLAGLEARHDAMIRSARGFERPQPNSEEEVSSDWIMRRRYDS